jgi:hypothetical protein
MSQWRAVELVKVNMIGLQALERIFTGFDNMVAGSACLVWQITDARENLGCQHNLVTQIVLFQEPSGDSLAFPFVVHIGGIEKIDASIYSFLHDRKDSASSVVPQNHRSKHNGRPSLERPSFRIP